MPSGRMFRQVKGLCPPGSGNGWPKAMTETGPFAYSIDHFFSCMMGSVSAYDNRRSDDNDLCMGRAAADFTTKGTH